MKKVSFIFLSKLFLQPKSSVFSEENELNLTSRKCVQRGSKNSQNRYQLVGRGWGGLLMLLAYGPGFLDYWAISPQVKKSKMITECQHSAVALSMKEMSFVIADLLTHYHTIPHFDALKIYS